MYGQSAEKTYVGLEENYFYSGNTCVVDGSKKFLWWKHMYNKKSN